MKGLIITLNALWLIRKFCDSMVIRKVASQPLPAVIVKATGPEAGHCSALKPQADSHGSKQHNVTVVLSSWPGSVSQLKAWRWRNLSLDVILLLRSATQALILTVSVIIKIVSIHL